MSDGAGETHFQGALDSGWLRSAVTLLSLQALWEPFLLLREASALQGGPQGCAGVAGAPAWVAQRLLPQGQGSAGAEGTGAGWGVQGARGGQEGSCGVLVVLGGELQGAGAGEGLQGARGVGEGLQGARGAAGCQSWVSWVGGLQDASGAVGCWRWVSWVGGLQGARGAGQSRAWSGRGAECRRWPGKGPAWVARAQPLSCWFPALC